MLDLIEDDMLVLIEIDIDYTPQALRTSNRFCRMFMNYSDCGLMAFANLARLGSQ
jgi:hypothetical protein